MGSARTYQFPGYHQSGIVGITGYFETDSGGDIANGVAGETDLDGDTLLLPPGFESVAKTATGKYLITLTSEWTKFVYIDVKCVVSAASKIEAQIISFNPKGVLVGSDAARTITFWTVDKNAASAVAFASKAFFVHILAKSTPVGVV